MSKQTLEILKWTGTFGFMLATLMLLSPHVASVSKTPWVIFVLGNIIWIYSAYKDKNWSFCALSVFYMSWDVLLVISRIYGPHFFDAIQPIINVLEMIP